MITFPDQDDTEDTTPELPEDESQQDDQTDDETVDRADADTSDPEAVESLAVVLAQPHPGTMRGEFTGYLSEEFPYEIESQSALLIAQFESDAEGDVAVRGRIQTGNDPEIGQDTEMEFRYVGDEEVYRRWSIVDSEEADHTWQPLKIAGTSENGETADPQEAELLERLLCVFPFEFQDDTFTQCDPYESSLALLESAQNAQILGVEDIRDVQTLALGFQMPLREMSASTIESYKVFAEEMIAFYSTMDFSDLLGSGEPGGDTDSPLGGDTDIMSEFADSINSMVAFLENADFEVHVNVDAEGRIRRVVIHIGPLFKEMAEAFELEEDPDESETTLLDIPYVMEFYDFGADISVETPPQEQISDDTTWPPVFTQN